MLSDSILPPPPYDLQSDSALPEYTLEHLTSKGSAEVTAKIREKVQDFKKKNPGEIESRIWKALRDINVEGTLKNLSENIHQINANFLNIKIALGMLDDKKYRKKKADGSANGEEIEEFKPTWKKIHENFQHLVQDSRNIATKNLAHVDVYMKVIIPLIKNDKVTLEVKQKELEIYIQNLEETKSDAEKMSAGFLELPPRIVEVETRLKQALKDVGANFEKRTSELGVEIAQLREKISKYTNLAETAMWVAVGGTSAMGLGGLLSIVPILGPVLFWGGAIVGLAGAVTDIVSSGLGIAAINEYNNKLDELDKITKSSGEFSKIEAQVNLAMNGCSDLCQRLSAIGGVWAVIRTESQRILESMSAAKKAGSNSGFESYLSDDLITIPYIKLGEVLALYANNVSPLNK